MSPDRKWKISVIGLDGSVTNFRGLTSAEAKAAYRRLSDNKHLPPPCAEELAVPS